MSIFLAFLLFISFNANAKEYKSILWITNSTSDIMEIEAFKDEKKLDFNFTLLTSLKTDVTSFYNIEVVDNLFNFYPIDAVFFPTAYSFKGIIGYNDNSVFFPVLFDYYQNLLNTSKKTGLFISSGRLKETEALLARSYNYEWLAGGISSQSISGVVCVSSFPVVIFDIIRSTDEFYSSKNNFILINDYKGGSSVGLLKTIFEDKNFEFISVRDGIKKSDCMVEYNNEMNFSPIIDYSDFEEKENMMNYLNYLILITRDISKYQKSFTPQIFGMYKELFEYFNPDLIEKEDAEENIRDITNNIYMSLGVETPYFVYSDFLKIPNLKNYIKEVGKDSVSFFSISTQRIKSFSIEKSSGNLVFIIDLSSNAAEGEYHIYIDINQRRNAGLESVIGKNEKLDSNYGWEYALIIKDKKVISYKAALKSYNVFKKYNFKQEDEKIYFEVNENDFPGNFLKWNYFVLNYDGDDLIGGVFERSGLIFLYPAD
ncbi:MAG: hypothetical protein K6357_01685 [Elusimicrobiota bacterium]